MEYPSLCIAAGVVLFLSKILLQLLIPDQSKYTEGVVGNKAMKDTEVPNPRRSSVCDCTCVD